MILPNFRGTLIIFIGYLCLLAWIPDSRAEEELEEIKSYNQLLNEVFQAETVYPQEEGEVQLLLGPAFSDGDDRNLFQVPFSIEYRMIQKWQNLSQIQTKFSISKDSLLNQGNFL